MSSDRYLNEFPAAAGEPDQPGVPSLAGETVEKENRLWLIWERLSHAGLGETVFRAGTHLLSITLVVLAIWGMRAFYYYIQSPAEGDAPRVAALAAPLPTPTPTPKAPVLLTYARTISNFENGIPRLAMLHTIIPARPRTEVTTYTVQAGDTVYGIAEQFGLDAETILWGNYYVLADNPHKLSPGQVLNILPLNGTYHYWSAGEGLNGVARGYGVTADVIVNWPGNNLDPATLGDWSHPNIEAGTMLVVPGGTRDFISWSAPLITRGDPSVAKILGPGFCGSIEGGVIGWGYFVWPADHHYLSGWDYMPESNHRAIDIDGDMGDPIYASDNGVVVYSGWNNWGYGNVVVIDHGNGWQTLYAHMSVINVGCGQSVFQGNTIGLFGSTGNSTGPHLHFEMMHELYGKVNPWDFLP